MNACTDHTSSSHTISVVVPVFNAETTLTRVVDELIRAFDSDSFRSRKLTLTEIILVNDCGIDNSDRVMRDLASRFPQVRNVWLSRNFGQHSATLAGIASARGDWIVTMDEDGQHNPEAIVDLHASALRFKSDLVYAELPPPSTHGWQRNFTSNLVKRHILPRVSDEKLQYFSSYRLILGEVARSVAAYVTSDVYLDIALSWVAREIRTCKIVSRGELRANSTYTRRKLIGHLIRLVLSSGTKPLRIGSLIGFISFLVGFLGALGVIFGKVSYGIEPVGWTSLASIVLIIGGLNLLILGIISEYIGIIVRTAIGRPVYVITNDRINGPLFRDGSQDL